ncbi:hypothetical protein AURDEDRAFT_188654 [Auricularia subglabra TFB-10046 SS5]|uniref:F-box domain-containing protein n=1 Tax=Auricularia subglabra (strain TFB-10046 / SS5) TaxID=717982 RepID=J0LF32_AURST|nr:hypothetical protein AURDEDRAFT_188654 [Auricularia subglabra TFB-10046 SS5]
MLNWSNAPPEILLQCFEALGPLNAPRAAEHWQRYPSLTTAALVCRSWLPCAQAVLLHCIVPRETSYTAVSRASVDQLVQVLTANRALARQARALRLQLGIDVHHCELGAQHADLDAVARLVNACTGLRRLHLTQSALTPPSDSFGPEQLALIRNHPSLIHLEMVCDYTPPAILYQCLNAWPTLQSLRLVGWSLPSPPEDSPPRCSLRQLVAETYGAPTSLLLSAGPQLETFTCTLNALPCLEHVKDTLRSLTIDCTYPSRSSSNGSHSPLTQCTKLERVTFRSGCPPGALEALPPSVTHVRILCAVDATRLTAVLDARPALTHVEVQLIRTRVRDDISRLDRVCRSQHITLGRAPSPDGARRAVY